MVLNSWTDERVDVLKRLWTEGCLARKSPLSWGTSAVTGSLEKFTASGWKSAA